MATVLLEVHKFQDYGKLSKRNQATNVTGARVEVAQRYKRQSSRLCTVEALSKNGDPGWDSD